MTAFGSQSACRTVFRAPAFYTGYGWYRKAFDVPAIARGKRYALGFEGAFQDAEVFVNGASVGRHRGGYTGFSFDVTSALHTGRNLVAVRVNNEWTATLAPRAGEHVFSGGLYRDVWLVSTGDVRPAVYIVRQIKLEEIKNDPQGDDPRGYGVAEYRRRLCPAR